MAGGSSLSSEESVFTLARYLSDGSLDLSFGTAGIVQTPIGDVAIVASIALQPDGSIVAGGGSSALFLNPKGFTLARYLSDGSLDPSFGSAGIVQTLIAGWAYVYSLALQPDGNIVAGGRSQTPSDIEFLTLARYIGAQDSPGRPGAAASAMRQRGYSSGIPALRRPAK